MIEAYEIIYYLYKRNKADVKGLRALYKYQYYLTEQEKKENPTWGKFIEGMNGLYEDLFANQPQKRLYINTFAPKQ